MFEGKAAADGKTADAADVAEVDVQRISVEPNMCPLENNLRLEMDFTVSADVAEAHWEIKYMVDSVDKRRIINLGRTKSEDYATGSHSFEFEVDRINVDGIKPSRLANSGLLIATLCAGGTEVIDVKLVVQVSQEEKDGGLTRCIFNPLE